MQNPYDKIINMVENGQLSWETVCQECLQRMSWDDVDDMIHECDWDY